MKTYRDNTFVLVSYSDGEIQQILGIKKYLQYMLPKKALTMFSEYIETRMNISHYSIYADEDGNPKIISFKENHEIN